MKEIKYKCDHCKNEIKSQYGMVNGCIHFDNAGYNEPPQLIYWGPNKRRLDLCENCMIKEIKKRTGLIITRM